MSKNKNNVREGDWVEYAYISMNDSYNGAEGEVIEILPDDGWGVMALVKWSNGEKSQVPANNLVPKDFVMSKAA